jgi:hypothetical protein
LANSGNPESGATGTGGISLTSESSLSSGFYFVTMEIQVLFIMQQVKLTSATDTLAQLLYHQQHQMKAV